MPTTALSEPNSAAQRRWRNLLLDRHLQLKFTGYSVAMALFAAALLGAFLFSTSRALMDEATAAVQARSAAAEQSRELGDAALSNELFAHMNDPAFEAELKRRSAAIDGKYELEKASIIQQREQLQRRQRLTWVAIVGVLLAFVSFVTLFSIFTTHKIAGPVYRVRKIMEELAQGRVRPIDRGLRDGDELKELFSTVQAAVERLRADGAETLQAVEAAARHPSAPEPLRRELTALAAKLKARLGDAGGESSTARGGGATGAG